MKSFFWKIVICSVPCLLALAVTVYAVFMYYKGEASRFNFKFGTDLVGGTILVYEIDVRKTMESDKEKSFDPQRDIAVLAESLKRRIDPNDLYNIVIRPAGGEGRVEIVLPTGGTHRAAKAEEMWQKLLGEMRAEYKVKNLEVGRGRVLELADRIQLAQAETIWKDKLFADKAGWERLVEAARLEWPLLKNKEREEGITDLKKLPQGDTDKLLTEVPALLRKYTGEAPNEKVMQTWLKQQAWQEMMTRARSEWKDLAPFADDMKRIAPDSNEQLVSFIQSKGSVVAQAGLALLEPLLGANLYADAPASKVVESFIEEYYGPSSSKILKDIKKYTEESGYGKDLTVEEVQRIKDLVSKVGSLEFRILANSSDDAEAIKDATELINVQAKSDPKLSEEMLDAQNKGLPPPGPRDADGNPKKYTIKLAHGKESVVTYSWVEIGPQERRALNLDNAAKNEPDRNNAWLAASLKRGEALKLPERVGIIGDQKLLQGALFFSRKCEDRNLPEEERRKKEIEYFILSRDPEYDPETNYLTRKPKIDGSYLTNAYSAPGPDLRPTVHFMFNNAGAQQFGDLTGKNVTEGTGPENTQKRRHLAIVLDGLVMSAPTIQSRIQDSGTITGSFTQKEVDGLVNILRAGRLPATLKPQPVSENTIGATLGEDTINAGVRAVLLAFAAVLVFMVVYYRFAGVVASVALLANLVLTVGFMVAVQATFTLPGLAGLVLMLGMAVDANVLIYERLREERERGASLTLALRNGYERALPTIIDTHLSSIFTAIVLYVVGNDQLKGFGVSLTVGLIISLFTSLYMTRAMFDFWQSMGWLKKLSMLRLFAKPDIDFMGIRYIMFGVTLGFALLGMAFFIGRLPNDLNIDFVGGTAYGAKLTQPLKITELRDLVGEDNQKKVFGKPDQDPSPKVLAKEEENSGGRRFELTFVTTGDKRTVSLNNIPPGDTPSLREKYVQLHASSLPDATVELIYTSEEQQAGTDGSKHFTVRTAEREPGLVQASLDQLLRDKDGKALMKKTILRPEKGEKEKLLENRQVRLQFFDAETGKDASGSPSFVKTLLASELRRILAIGEKEQLPVVIEVIGEGKSENDGSYHIIKVAFGEMKAGQEAKAEEALRATRQAFQDHPQPDRLENFDSQLAADTRLRAMWAVLASWGAILIYLWFRFGNWTFGLAAVICLVHDLFLTLGAIAVCHYLHGTIVGDLLGLDDFKIDLPSVAALLTLVGYSVNDTIVVFDRIREVRGKNPDLTAKMINDSVNQTLSRTVLASLTTWLVVFVLYVWGGPGVHLFAFVMVVGVVVGTYSSIYIASPLLLWFGEGHHEESKAGEREPRAVPMESSTAIRAADHA